MCRGRSHREHGSRSLGGAVRRTRRRRSRRPPPTPAPTDARRRRDREELPGVAGNCPRFECGSDPRASPSCRRWRPVGSDRSLSASIRSAGPAGGGGSRHRRVRSRGAAIRGGPSQRGPDNPCRGDNHLTRPVGSAPEWEHRCPREYSRRRRVGAVQTAGTTPSQTGAAGTETDGLQVARYSGRGPTFRGDVGVDVVAPPRPWIADGTPGTSAAAARTAGIAALVLDAAPSLDPERVRAILRHSAGDIGRPGHDLASGWGVLDGIAAVQRARAR